MSDKQSNGSTDTVAKERRKANDRRSDDRRLDERRTAGIGEVQADRRHVPRRRSDRRIPSDRRDR